MAKRKPKRLSRPLRPDEYVVFRDRKGRVRKYDKRLLLTAEVWSKRTGRKTQFVLNYLKDGKPSPQRFKPAQKTLMITTRGRTDTKQVASFDFTVTTDTFLSDQIPADVMDGINDEVRKRPVWMKVRVDFSSGAYIEAPETYLDRPILRDVFAPIIAVQISNAARSIMVRMSPKKHARNEKEARWEHPKSADVRITLSSVKTKRQVKARGKTKAKAKSKTKKNRRSVGTRHRRRLKRKR